MKTIAQFATVMMAMMVLGAEPAFELKKSNVRSAKATSRIRTMQPGRVHLLVQFAEVPTPADYEALQERGAKIVGTLPGSGYVVSVMEHTDLSGLNATTTQLQAANKMSEAVQESPNSFYVVDFHTDVPPGDAESIVNQTGMRIHQHPDLLRNQLIVEGSLEGARQISEWDEVAYVFPASNSLIEGLPVSACAGAVADEGRVGQYIATVGNGWDGPGLGSAQLTYTFAKLTNRLPSGLAQSTIEKALAEWSKVARIDFSAGSQTDAKRNLNFLFEAGSHGDRYAFDGPGKTLAHAFYPSQPNAEPIAGDLHFDADENWQVGADVDLFSVALHELGHSLGLGHSDRPGSVMYPYYQKVTELTAEDIGAIRRLYAARTGDSSTAPMVLSVREQASTDAAAVNADGQLENGSGSILITWKTNRGMSGTAEGTRNWIARNIPVATGANTVMFTATDATGASVSKTITINRAAENTSVTLDFQAVPAKTAQTDLTISGSATHSSGIRLVRWKSAAGAGTANGTSNWYAAVRLQAGQNVVSLTAVANDGSEVTKTVDVAVEASNDTTRPSLTVTAPYGSVYSTSVRTLTMSGTARDNVNVKEISWTTSNGQSGVASGTTQWSIANVSVPVGTMNVIVKAFDASGNSSWRSLTVVGR